MWIFPLGAAVVSLVFGVLLGRAWLHKRRAQMAAWCVALLMFGLASAVAAAGMLFEWTTGWYRTYYLLGAIVNVPILALGTVYLLGPRTVAHILAIGVLVASVLATAGVLGAELNVDRLDTSGIPSGRVVMPDDVRTLSRYYSFGGSLVVVGGALYSAWRLARRREDAMRRLAIANVLIATGTVVVGLAGSFARAGRGSVLGVGLLLGVSIMFAGFLRSRSPASA